MTKSRMVLILVAWLASTSASTATTPPIYQYYAHFHVEGQNPSGAKYAIFTAVFAYCTPTHDISQIVQSEREEFKALLRERMGGTGSAYFYWDAGNFSEEQAERVRQQHMNPLRAAGYRVEERPYNIAIYAPARDCR